MRKMFTVLAILLTLLVVLEFYLAASGAFDAAPNDESFGPHRSLGRVILLYALLLTLVAALARLPGRLVAKTGLVAVLGVLQPVIAGVANAFGDTSGGTTAGELVFGLHAVNGLAIIALLGMIVREARGRAGAASSSGPAGTTADAEATGSAS